MSHRGRSSALLILLFAALRAAGDEPHRLLLTSDVEAVPPAGWHIAPPLLEHRTPPDLLLGARPATFEAAAEELVKLLDGGAVPLAQPGNWLRLDGIDLCSVAECADCRPVADPHEVYEPATVTVPTDDDMEFWMAAAAALGGRDVRPYVVVAQWLNPRRPAGLVVLCRGSGLSANALEYEVLDDGFGELLGLPLNRDLLRPRLNQPRVAVVRRPSQLMAEGPDWLTARLDAVRAGATHPLGEWFRADDPMLAKALDVYAPLRPKLVEPRFAVAAALVDAVATLAEYDAGRADATNVRVRLAQPQLENASPELARRLVALRALPLERLELELPPAPAANLDGMLAPGEWRSAALAELRTHDDGTGSERPADLWLARAGDGLHLAVSATEPDPDNATLNDRLLAWLATDAPGAPMTMFSITVGGEVTAERNGEPIEPAGVTVAALFDGPGWTMELRLPLPPGERWRLNLATEHRAGYQRDLTFWRPTAAMRRSPARYARIR